MDLTSPQIVAENSRAGTDDWKISAPSWQEIEGYASSTSVGLGDELNIFANCTSPTFGLNIYRMGWYQGLGARLVQSYTNLPQIIQPVPTFDASRLMAECRWTPSVSLSVPNTWLSGCYMIRLFTETPSPGDSRSSYIPFVVRDDSSTSLFLYQMPICEYHAYNAWPRQGSPFWNAGVYGGNLYSRSGGQDGLHRAYAVSLNRPINQQWGAGSFFYVEFPLIAWLEKLGLDVSYITNVDTDRSLSMLLQHRVFISGGHDEYWSGGMRANLEAALAQGMSAAFMAGNPMYWQTRFEDSFDGPRRRIVCYKDGFPNPETDIHGAPVHGAPVLDPIRAVNVGLTTARWRDAILTRPEESVVGQMYIDWIPDNQDPAPNRAWPATFKTPISWPYDGTGITDGESIPGVLGGEVDHAFVNGEEWGGTPLTGIADLPSRMILADSEVPSGTDSTKKVPANTTIYTTAAGGLVFSTGTHRWNWCLAQVELQWVGVTTVPDRRLQTMTLNILEKLAEPAGWTMETGDLRSYTLSDTRIAVWKTDGNLYVKEGPLDAGWTMETGDFQSFALNGNRIGVLFNDGNLYVKEGPLDAGWASLGTAVSSFQLEGDRIAMLTRGALFVKEIPQNTALRDPSLTK
jgi:hypothetical protein